MTSPAPEDDHHLAARLARQTGELLVGLRDDLTGAGAATATLKAEGDRRGHEFLTRAIAESRPDDAVLSEEGEDDPTRLQRDRVWIVDPLDGTREFSEPPRSDWAVHVALVTDGTAELGAVALPALGQTLGTGPLTPRLAPAHDGPLRVVVSRTRPPDVALRVRDALDGRLVEMGSAGAKAMAVVRGDADIYVHAGGQYEWDSAAPVAVATAAGLHTSRLDGSPLVYNRADPYLPDLVVCRPEHAEAALAVLG